ncbi:MAG: DUF4397 domain-containing protein [Pseudobacter sp.]|uniref:DUF4397 domain-containing protein n=1 Tax=Pseudobacter sp. TaxID=2045420 RepID=UPI003F813A20
MNKILSCFRRLALPVVAVAVSGVLFSACLKNKDGDSTQIPAAGLMAFNLAPDQQSLVIQLSGNTLTQSPLAYQSFTGVYQNIYTGNRSVSAFDYPDPTPLVTSSQNFEQGKYYSLFVVGTGDKYKNVISTDNFDSLSASSGKAYVRYINAIADSVNAAAVTITANGSSVVNNNAVYATVSEFKEVNPGEVTIAVKSSNGVDVNRTISLEPKKVYTVLLSGIPKETNESSKVQIRFVTNGTLTDESPKP